MTSSVALSSSSSQGKGTMFPLCCQEIERNSAARQLLLWPWKTQRRTRRGQMTVGLDRRQCPSEPFSGTQRLDEAARILRSMWGRPWHLARPPSWQDSPRTQRRPLPQSLRTRHHLVPGGPSLLIWRCIHPAGPRSTGILPLEPTPPCTDHTIMQGIKPHQHLAMARCRDVTRHRHRRMRMTARTQKEDCPLKKPKHLGKGGEK